MNVPQIIFQSNPRWLMVRKPRGWSLASRGNSTDGSIESFLTPILNSNKRIYFPFEVDSRIPAIAAVCCDRGIQSQFDKFRASGQMQFTYRVRGRNVSHVCLSDNHLNSVSTTPVTHDGSYGSFDLTCNTVLTVRKLDELLGGGGNIRASNIHLYRWSFPIPNNPLSGDIEVSIPPDPPEGWDD